MADFERIENPYIIGNPVRGGQPFFGREDDFAYAEQRLRTEREGIVLVFVGGRRSGKTSIMFQILDGRLGPDFLPVFIDMQQLAGVQGDAELLGRMARTVIEGLDDERLVVDYYRFEAGNPILTFDRLLADVAQIFPDRRMLFLVDEAELLRDKVARGEISSAVLTFMASALESRRVSYFFTGSTGLAETNVAEWKRLLGKGDMQEISFLSRADTARLVQEPVAGQVDYADGVVEAIYELSYGQPFYTQLICTTAIDHLNTQRRNHLAREDLDEVVRTIVNSPPPQLLYDWEQFDRSERLTLSLLSEVSEVPHTPVPPEAVMRAIEENEYPIDLSANEVHMVLDGLDSKKVLERSEDGGYHFLVDLVRLWIRRSRSVWRLVEEQEAVAKKPRWVVLAAVAGLAGLAVLAVALLSSGGQEDPGPVPPVLPETGGVWLQAFPIGSTAEIRGPLGGPGEPERVSRSDTPTLVDARRPGRYRVSVRHPLYATQIETVQVEAGRRDTVRNHLERLMGRLWVLPVQEEAQVRVRAQDGGGDTTVRGPLRGASLPTGTYRVEVSLAGYVSWSGQEEVVAGEERRLEPDLNADVGDLVVISDPPGATVFLDGLQQGAAPRVLRTLSTRRHAVRLALTEYQVVDTIAVPRYRRRDTLRVRLSLRPGVLDLTSAPPGASIRLDGKSLADTVTPQRITRPPRRYRLWLELPGYDVHEQTVELAPGRTTPLDVRLVQQFGWVKIVRPAFGTLSVDGEVVKRGRALGVIELPVGEHRLQLEGKSEDRTVVITKGDTARVLWE